MVDTTLEESFINEKAYDKLWKMYFPVIHEPFQVIRLTYWLPFWNDLSPNKVVEEQLVDDFKQLSEHK